MAYNEYKYRTRSLGRILYELSQIGIPLPVVQVVCLKFGDLSSNSGELTYYNKAFATYTWTPGNRPIFSFVGYGADCYNQLQEQRNLEYRGEMTPYFRQQLGFWIDKQVLMNLSQSQYTEPGRYLGRLYYQTSILDKLEKGANRTGFPHNGGEHSLRITAPVSMILEFIEDMKKHPVPYHYQGAKEQFINIVERKLYESA